MSITATGTAPVAIAVGTTATTDARTDNVATPVTADTRAWRYNDTISATTLAAASVTLLGLEFETQGGSALSFTHNATATISQTQLPANTTGTAAVALIGSGGDVTYTGNGTVSSTVASGVVLTQTAAGAGNLLANVHEDITTSANGAVGALILDQFAVGGTGNVTANIDGGVTVSQTGTADTYGGIFAKARGTAGNATVTLGNTAGTTTVNANGEGVAGVQADSLSGVASVLNGNVAGNSAITVTGTGTGGNSGIFAASGRNAAGTDTVVVATGAGSTISVNGGNDNSGIFTRNYTDDPNTGLDVVSTGNINITTGSGSTITATGTTLAEGIGAYTHDTTGTATSITILSNGGGTTIGVTGGQVAGINAHQQAAGGTGNVSVTTNTTGGAHTINVTDNTVGGASAGISAANAGSGTVLVTSASTINALGAGAADVVGINAAAGTGNITVSVNGAVNASTGTGVRLTGGTTNTVDATAAITGATGVRVAGGTTTLTSSVGSTTISGTTAALDIDSGTLVVGNGNISLVGGVADDGVLAINRTTTFTVAGAISGGGALQQNGAATTTLTGANTYTGGTTISAGTLQLGNGGTTGSIVGNVLDNAILAINRSNTFTFADDISGTGTLQQIGAGTTILTATSGNTYGGATTVNAGTLQVDGSITSATTVNSGGTLGGSGTVDAVTVNSGGTVAPGASPGILTTGNFTLSAGASLQVEIEGTAAPGVGGYDQLIVNGSVTLGGDLSTVLIGGFHPATGATLTIIANDGVDAVVGTFANVGATFTQGGSSYSITYAGGTNNNDVVLTALNDGPVTDLNGAGGGDDATASFTEQTPVVIAPAATITDIDDTNMESLTATLTARPDGDAVESLSLNAAATTAAAGAGLTVLYTPATGVLSVTGSAGKATYENDLQGIQYNNTSDTPTTTNRNVDVVVNDGTASSALNFVTIGVTAVNDAPVTDLNGGVAGDDATASFTEQTPVVLAPAATVTDDGANLASLTATLTNRPNGDAAESLSLNAAATTAATGAGLTVLYTPATGILSVTGSASKATYQTILQGVLYNNTSNTPVTTSRNVDVVVNDGSLPSALNTVTIGITAVNDLPVNAVPGAQTIPEDTAQAITGISVSDVDVNGTPLNVQVTLSVTDGILDVRTDVGGGLAPWQVSGDTTGTVVLTGTTAQINATLGSANGLNYQGNLNATGPDVLTVNTNDLGNTGTPGPLSDTDTVNINVTAAAPTNTLTAFQSSALVTDVDLDGQIDPGDTVLVTVQITNNSATVAATGVSFSETLSGLTENGVINVSPVAIDDLYNAVGNATLTVNAATGVLANDHENFVTFGTGVGQTRVDSTGTFATSAGGSVTLNADGSFTYSAPFGFNGLDTFNYTVRDAGLDGTFGNGDDLSDGGVITFDVQGMAWFIDNTAPGSSNIGTQANPFTSIAAFNTANVGGGTNPDVGDSIYLREGTYSESDGINLLNNQLLTGQGQNFVVNGITLETGVAGQTPIISVTGASQHGIDLGSGNTIKGLNVATTQASQVGIDDNVGTVGSLNISDVDVTGVGQAVDIDEGGALTVTIDNLTSTGSGAQGVQLAGVGAALTGTFTVTTGAISGSTGTAFQIGAGDAGAAGVGGTATVSYTGTIANAGAARAVEVQDRAASAGTVTFAGNITQSAGGTASGIVLDDNVAGNVTFSGATNTFNSTTATAINITDQTGGTVTFSNAVAVNTTTGAGVNIGGTTTGSTINFTGGGTGLDITTGAGTGFSATGGGTISVQGAGNFVDSAGQAINLTSVTVGGGNIAFASTDSDGGARGVNIDTVTGGSISLGTGTLSGHTAAEIDINAGNSAITYGGTIGNGTGLSAEITGHSTGNITLSGNITDTNDAGGGIVATGNTGGTIAFSGTTKTLNTGASAGVTLADNNGATINFTGGGLDIDTSTGTGFTATAAVAGTGGTVNVTGSGNSITSGTGTALNMVNTNIGASDVTFVSITSSGGANVGINLNTTGTAGGLNVTGNGIAGTTAGEGTGGTISSKSGDGIVLNNTAHVRLNDMIIGANAATAGEGQPNATNNIVGDGIKITSVTPTAGSNYGLTLDNVTISQTGGDGIDGSGGNNIGLRVDASRFLNIGDDTAGTTESAINFGTGFPSTDQITGHVHISDSMFAGFTAFGFTAENSGNGTLNMTVEDSTFKNNDANLVGDSGIQLIIDGSTTANNPKLNLLVEDVTFSNIDLDSIEVTTDPGGTSNVTIRRTTHNNPQGDNAIHMVSGSADADDVETMNVWIEDTTVTANRGTLIFLKAGAGTYNATVTNTAGFTGELDSGLNADGAGAHIGRGIEVLFDADNAETINAKVLIENQTLRNIGVDGIQVTNFETLAGTTIDVAVKNNVIGEVGAETGRSGTGEGIEVRARSLGTINFEASGNTIRMRNPGAANPGMEGIDLDAEDSATLNATIVSNSLNNPGNTGPNINATSEAAGATLNLDIRLNTSAAGNDTDYNLTNSAGTFRVEGAGAGAVTPANITGANPGGGTASVTGTVLFNNNVNVTQPATPTVPTLPPPPPASLLVGDGGVQADDPASAGSADDPATAPVGDDTSPATGGEAPAEQPGGSGGASAHPVIVDDGVLSQAELAYIVDAALARWIATGLSAEQIAALEDLTISVGDMSGLYLGSYTSDTITLDLAAAGYGWFVDLTPLDDAEFANGTGTRLTTDPTGAPAGHIDLLTTVMHEMGHQLGLEDEYAINARDDLMYGYLFTGERRLPAEHRADGATPGSITTEEFAVGPIAIGTLPAGETVTIQFQATVNTQNNQFIVNPTNQGTVTATNVPDPPNFSDVNTNSNVTTLDSLTLGNQIFNDVNGNSLFETGLGETGIDNVALTLFADTNGSGGLDGGDVQLATATTAGGGLYSFFGLAPGDYIVRVDQSNFNVGGALEFFPNSSPGNPDPDNNVDNDDNGAVIAGNNGVASSAITLAYNTEPTNGTGNDTNNTLDMGFFNVPPNAAPVVTTTGTSDDNFTEGGPPADLEPAPDLTVDDDSNIIESAIVTITDFFAGDELLFTLQPGITGGYANGVLTLNGSASELDYQAVLRSVQYSSTSDNPDQFGTNTDRIIQWVVNDGTQDSLAASTTIQIFAVNDAPVLIAAATPVLNAVDEDAAAPAGAVGTLVSALVNLDFPVGGGLDNVTDPDNQNIGIALTGVSTTNGTWFYSLNDGALWTAVPSVSDAQALLLAADTQTRLYFQPTTADFNGTVSAAITFRAWDRSSGANGASGIDTTTNGNATAFSTATDTANITVSGVVDAVTDTATVGEDSGANTVDVLANDTFENASRTLTSFTQGTGGTVTRDDNGSAGDLTDDRLIYTPNADFNGPDTFTYTVTSGGVTEIGTVNVTVGAVADAVNDTLTTNEDTAVTANVITGTNGASADNFEGSPVIQSVTQGANGTVTFAANGDVTYTPNADFNGADSFTYTVLSGGATEGATVSVTVNVVADIVGDAVSVDEDSGANNFNLLGNDTFENPGRAITAVGAATHGTTAINDAGTPGILTDDFVTYTPTSLDFNGSDTFNYTVTSGGVTEQAAVNVTITAVADAVNDSAAVVEDSGANTIDVLANDTFEDPTRQLTSFTQGSNGTVTRDDNATPGNLVDDRLIYTPNANFDGTDSFTYTVTPPNGTAETATVSITMTPVNDAPALNAAATPVMSAQNEDSGAPVGVVGTLVASLVDLVGGGGVDNVTELDSGALVGIALTGTNTTNGTWFYSTNNGTNWIAVGVVSDASALLLAADVSTRLYFQPNADFNGTVTNAVTFRAWDQSNGIPNGTSGVNTSPNGLTTAFSTASDTANLTVNAVADIANDGVTVAEDSGTNTLNLLANDTFENAARAITTVGAALNGTTAIDNNGTPVNTADDFVTYAPNANYNGPDTFTYTVTSGGVTEQATVTVAVTAVNDGPANTVPGAQAVNEDAALAITGLSIADVDAGSGTLTTTLSVVNGVLTVGSVGGGAAVSNNGTSAVTLTGTVTQINATLAAAGAVLYTGNANFNGADTLTVTTNDGGNTGLDPGLTGNATSEQDTDTVGITVNAVNDGPVNTLPASVTALPDHDRAIAGLAIADVDAAGGVLSTILHVDNGILNVASAGGAGVAGSGTDTVTLTGTLAQINTSLSAAGNVVYNGDTGFLGTDTLTMTTNDGGNTGLDPGLTGTATSEQDIDQMSIEVRNTVNTNDFNGDGKSDILWRHESGPLATWELDSGVIVHYHFQGGVDNSYSVDAVADFDGNGTADVLWRHDSGFIITWDIDHTQTGYHAIGPSNPADEIAGTGDFNGDGKAELLWRNADTGVVSWQLNTGPFVDTDLNGDEIAFTRTFPAVTSDWDIVGTGDVNGDGKSDIFWRHDSGQLVSWEVDDGTIIGFHNYGTVGNDYEVVGTGDFNGDGRSGDLVWRHVGGQVVTWELDGGTQVGYHDFGIVTNDYTIEDTGDYNGDGRSDILWRHDSGLPITWELDGGAIIGYHAFPIVDPVWQIQT